MVIRNEEQTLTKIKKALLISPSDSFADEEIKLHIGSCTNYLISLGVKPEVASSNNPLVEGLILIYVKTFYGFKSDGSVKELPLSFELLVRQLVLTESGV